MKRYLVQQGVPESAVVVDNQGVDTRASAVNAAAFLRRNGMHSVFVITQYFHVPRCRIALKKAGIETVYSAHPFYFEWRDIYSALRELPACVKYAF